MIDASRCPACDRVATPPEPKCMACGGQTQPERLALQGKVLAATRPRDLDAWIALLELDGGARILARAAEVVEVGDRVTAGRAEDGYRVQPGEAPDR